MFYQDVFFAKGSEVLEIVDFTPKSFLIKQLLDFTFSQDVKKQPSSLIFKPGFLVACTTEKAMSCI